MGIDAYIFCLGGKAILHDGKFFKPFIKEYFLQYFSDKTVKARKATLTKVYIASEGQKIETIVGGNVETTFIAEGDEIIFENNPQDVFVPRDKSGKPNGREILKQSYDWVKGGVRDSIAFYRPNKVEDVAHEVVTQNTVIFDAYGEGQHQYLTIGATLKIKGDRVTGINKEAFDNTWELIK